MSSIKCNKTQSMPLGTQPAGKQSGVGCQPLETVNNMSWVFFLFNFKDFQCILYLLIKIMALAHIASHTDYFLLILFFHINAEWKPWKTNQFLTWRKKF